MLFNLCQVLTHFRDNGESIDHLLPGDIYLSNFQITISLAPDSAQAWKKAIKLNYQNVIIGSQKTTTTLVMKVIQFS